MNAMQFAKPIPYENEAAFSVLTRFARANSCPDRQLTLKGLRATLGLPSSTNGLHVLSHATGMPAGEFIYKHTTIPLLRAFSPYLGKVKESRSAASVTNTYRLITGITSLRYCRSCVAQQLRANTPPASYWNRLHQLPHLDWCVTHGEPLVVKAGNSLEYMPHEEACNALDNLPTSCESELSNAVLHRYADLINLWIKSTKPISAIALAETLRKGCKKMDLRIAQHGKRPVISDIALELLPQSWIARHMPDLLSKTPGQFLQRLDGVAKDSHVPYPISSSALAAALLYESVEAFQTELALANQRLESTDQSVGGLSGLIESAKCAFRDGASISQVCKSHSLTLKQLEPMLREAVRGH